MRYKTFLPAPQVFFVGFLQTCQNLFRVTALPCGFYVWIYSEKPVFLNKEIISAGQKSE